MDNNWNIQIYNGSQYNLDRRGLLQIRNVTEDDNGTEYRCTLKKKDGEESIRIILTFLYEEGKINTPIERDKKIYKLAGWKGFLEISRLHFLFN